MNAKEEADRIIDMYRAFDINVLYSDSECNSCIATDVMTFKSAVKCAIIHVKGIIENRPTIKY